MSFISLENGGMEKCMDRQMNRWISDGWVVIWIDEHSIWIDGFMWMDK